MYYLFKNIIPHNFNELWIFRKCYKMIFKNYDVKTFKTGKRENKLKLQKMLGLNEDKDVMLIGMVSRLSVQKGFDLITYMAEEFLIYVVFEPLLYL